jgi:hypothetical protein
MRSRKVQLRKELYADGVIDREEADLLFELNDATSGAANDPSWNALFVEAISDFLLKDEISPGEVDDNEAEWLLARIVKDGVFDENEKALIAALKANAKSLPEKLLKALK